MTAPGPAAADASETAGAAAPGGPGAGSFTVPASHPSLPGHFPGRPIVPGVVLLDLVIAAAERAHPGRRVAGFPAVKFLRPVRPGQDVAVLLHPGADRIGVSCTVAGAEVLRGTLLLAPALPEPSPPAQPVPLPRSGPP